MDVGDAQVIERREVGHVRAGPIPARRDDQIRGREAVAEADRAPVVNVGRDVGAGHQRRDRIDGDQRGEPEEAQSRQQVVGGPGHVRVDDLLRRPEFADYWALKWADLLRVDRQALGHKRAYAYYKWIRDSLAANRPYDQFVRELVTAEGPLAEVGAGR